MRFAISHVLDAIERRASVNPLATGAVVNLDEIVRLDELDGGPRPTTLRLGLVIDALGRHLADSTAAVYAVADRSLLSDTELSSNERMAIRRWSDDGMVEVLPAGAPVNERVGEISVLLGAPVISRNPGFGDGRLVPTAASGGVVLKPASEDARPPAPSGNAVLTRRWRCREPDCPSFGSGHSGVGQSPPHLYGGKPVCPRHGVPLADGGPLPPAQAMVARIGGVVRHRFIVSTEAVVVGRSPDGPEQSGAGRQGPAPSGGGFGADRFGSDGFGGPFGSGGFDDDPFRRGGSTSGAFGLAGPGAGGFGAEGAVKLGPYLDEVARRRVSRNHVRLEIRPEGLTVTDLSTNGTAVYTRDTADEPGVRTKLTRDEARVLGRWDTVQLHVGVDLGRAGQKWPGASDVPAASVMADAPTMAIRLPRG